MDMMGPEKFMSKKIALLVQKKLIFSFISKPFLNLFARIEKRFSENTVCRS